MRSWLVAALALGGCDGRVPAPPRRPAAVALASLTPAARPIVHPACPSAAPTEGCVFGADERAARRLEAEHARQDALERYLRVSQQYVDAAWQRRAVGETAALAVLEVEVAAQFAREAVTMPGLDDDGLIRVELDRSLMTDGFIHRRLRAFVATYRAGRGAR